MDVLSNVIKEYPNRNSLVTIINMPQNSGLHVVRKVGSDRAIGEYVIHCDSDDYVELNMFETMYSEAKLNNFDIVICDYNYVDTKSKYSVKSKLNSNGLAGSRFTAYIWCKLIKRELFTSDIEWPYGDMLEDLTLTIQLVQKAKKVGYISQPLYNYVNHTDSMLGQKSKEALLKKWPGLYKNADIICSKLDRTKYKNDILLFKDFVRSILNPCINDDDVWKLYRNSYPEIDLPLLFNKDLSFRKKIRIIMYRSLFLHKLAHKLFSKADKDYR